MKVLKTIISRRTDKQNNRPVTIVFFGDSVTQGCFEAGVCEPESSFVAKFRKIMSTLYPAAKINIINSGVGGNNAADGLVRFDRDVAEYSPDLVVVGFALNDACGGEAHLKQYENDLTEMCEKVKSLNAECIVLTPNMMCAKSSAKVADDMKGLSESFTKIQNGGLLDKIAETEKAVAVKCGVEVCDVYSCWKRMAENGVDTTELLSNGLNHPIRQMHELTAYKIVETLFGD